MYTVQNIHVNCTVVLLHVCPHSFFQQRNVFRDLKKKFQYLNSTLQELRRQLFHCFLLTTVAFYNIYL